MFAQKFAATGNAVLEHSTPIAVTLQVVLFPRLTAIGAQLEIPHPPVPFTLQTLFVLLSGAILGPRLGAVSMLVYLGAGVAGLPVFSSFGFGIARLLGPTGGYLLAFPAAAFIVGYLRGERPTFPRLLLSMAAALVVVFACGTIQLRLTLLPAWFVAFNSGFLLFSWWDLVKLFGSDSTARSIFAVRGYA